MIRLKAIDGSTVMDAADAFQIVLDLARQNALDAIALEAIGIIEDLATNDYGDD